MKAALFNGALFLSGQAFTSNVCGTGPTYTRVCGWQSTCASRFYRMGGSRR